MSWASETIENQNTSGAHFDSTYSWLMVKSCTVRPVLWKLEIFQCTEWMNNIFTEPFLTLLEVFLSDLMAWRVDCGFAQPNGCGLAGDDWSISCLLLTCEDRIDSDRRKNSQVHDVMPSLWPSSVLQEGSRPAKCMIHDQHLPWEYLMEPRHRNPHSRCKS